MTYDAVIFDLDGTLVDSERNAQAAGIKAFAKQGVTVDLAFMVSMVGKDDTACRAIIKAAHPRVDYDQLDRDFMAENNATYDRITPMPGAMAALQHLHTAGIKIAVATSSNLKNATRKLEQNGMLPLLQTVVSRDDVSRAKPDPEPFVLAAKRMNVAPDRCLAVEDSPTGVAAALAAGMTVLHVPDLVRVDHSDAHILAPSLLDGLQTAKALM